MFSVRAYGPWISIGADQLDDSLDTAFRYNVRTEQQRRLWKMCACVFMCVQRCVCVHVCAAPAVEDATLQSFSRLKMIRRRSPRPTLERLKTCCREPPARMTCGVESRGSEEAVSFQLSHQHEARPWDTARW